MNHPAFERLAMQFAYPTLRADQHDGFVSQPGLVLLFFAGDPARDRESVDVAVILPELAAALDQPLRPAVIPRSRQAEVTLQAHYGFREWPTLVLLRDGAYLGAISRVQDWSVYMKEFAQLLASEPRRPPGFKIPVVAE